MIEFVKRLFGQTGSSTTAKERLRLVLMTDHLALAPEIIDQMKRDLVDVISRYVEVDREKVEVNFEREDKALAMMANIPIVAVNRPPAPPVEVPPELETAPVVADVSETVGPSTVASAPNVTSPGAPPKRRRRKKNSSSATTAPAH